MEKSILKSTKKMIGLDASYDAFDLDVLTHTNSVFSTLHQLGVGPPEGFMIEDAITTWDDYFEDFPNNMSLNNIKSYVFLRVRLLFDAPATSYHITAMQEQIKEMEYRINVEREGVSWNQPLPSTVVLP